MKKVGVILCSQTKKDYGCDVRQMYNDSISFRARRIFMDFVYHEWYVNTSKYGFMEPSFIVEPYDSWYITSTNTRNKATALTEDMIEEWLDRVKLQYPDRENIHLDCHLSTPYYNRLKTIFPNITYQKQHRVLNKTAWRYYDAVMLMLNGGTLNDAFELLNEPEPKPKRTETDKWFYHVDGETFYGKSGGVSKKYGINDLNIWSVSMGDTLQTQGWVIDKSILQHITKTDSGRYMLPRGIAKKNTNMDRGDIKLHLDKLEERVGGKKYYELQNDYDDVMDVLDRVWEENDYDSFTKLLIYENSFSIINESIPNHNMTDYFLEMATYEWLDNER